jgi:nicotinate-nucleotide pyrophosphorylase (carboxylating)
LCGTQFVDAVFYAVDPGVSVKWNKADGDRLAPNDVLFTLAGNARSILTGERAALNFLQMLSGTASYSASLASIVREPTLSYWIRERLSRDFETPRSTQ